MFYYTSNRYFDKKAGKNGMYFPTDGNSIIDAWRDPEKFGLELEPLPRFKSMEPEPFYALSGWVEEWFHSLEKTSERGTKFHVRELCTGPGCELCKSKAERVFGRKVFLQFSHSQWGAWLAARERARCRCQCGGVVYVSHYICGGCQEALYDFANACYNCNSEDLSIDEEREEFNCGKCGSSWSIHPSDNTDFYKEVTARTKCKCGAVDIPKAVRYCTACGEEYKSHTLLDFQMKLSSEQKGKGRIIKITNLVVQEPDARLFDPKLQAKDSELGQKIAESNKNPINLIQVCAPFSHEEEAELLKVGNPFNMGGDEDNFRPYHQEETTGTEAGATETEEEPKPAPVGKPKGAAGGRPVLRRPPRK